MKIYKKVSYSLLCIGFFALLLAPQTTYAYDSAQWNIWVKKLKTDVINKGINPALAARVLDNMRYDPAVIKHDNAQPSKSSTFVSYKSKAVNPNRVARGQAFYKKHHLELEKFATQYGVSAPTMVALIGIESDYGGYTGTFDVIRSMSTLAYGTVRKNKTYQEKRKKMFRDEIYYALKIYQDGIIKEGQFKGSWAGASGINQHMPSSYYAKVVDGDKDGDRDIWNLNDLSDVFATTAHHMQSVGWKAGQKWGRRVALPPGFSKSLIGNKIKKPLSTWRAIGVKLPNGQPLPAVDNMIGSIIAPDGLGGPVYIGYDNFHAFRRWNRSDYFALVVGSLSDQIAAGQ